MDCHPGVVCCTISNLAQTFSGTLQKDPGESLPVTPTLLPEMTAVVLHRWRSWRRSLSLNSRMTRGSSLAGSPSRTGPRCRSPGRGWTRCGPTTRALSGEETGGPEDPCTSRRSFPYRLYPEFSEVLESLIF